MTRAMVEYERAPNGDWRPIVVYQATSDHVEARGDPCNPRAAWKLANYTGMYTPSPGEEGRPATWEDWIGLMLDKFANGYTSMAAEVEPAATVDDLYARYAKDIEAASPAASWPPNALEVEIDPVGTPGSPELVEMSFGLVVHVERETDRRLYGAVMDSDGEAEGAYGYQTSFRKDRITRRTPLAQDAPPWRSADSRTTRHEGWHRWRLELPDAGIGPCEEAVLQRYPVPKHKWPAPVGTNADLEVLRDRFIGTLIGGAIGGGLARPVDGLSRAQVQQRYGVQGVSDLPPEGALWTRATRGTVDVARSLIEGGGLFDPTDFVARIVAWTTGGHSATDAGAAWSAGEPWYRAGPRIDAADNGAAVRSAPIGLVHVLGEASTLLREAVRFALPTHGGPVGVAGAVAVSAAVGYLARLLSAGSATIDTPAFLEFVATGIGAIESVPTPTRRPPSRTIFLRDRIRRISTWLDQPPTAVFRRIWTGPPALESVPAALYCFLRSPDRPRETLLTAANASHDVAAIGSLAGALSGAWLGGHRLSSEVPRWWEAVERRQELLDLADSLLDTALDVADAQPPATSPLGRVPTDDVGTLPTAGRPADA